MEPVDDIIRLADGLERLAQVISGVSGEKARTLGLSRLQLGILSLLAVRDGGLTGGFLARRFMNTAATISDSVRTLKAKGLISRIRNKDDARSFLIAITETGRELVARSVSREDHLRQIVSGWDETRRGEVLAAAVDLIHALQSELVFPVDRVCPSCRFFAINCDLEADSTPYYCRFYSVTLRALDLRVDCSDFELQEPM